MWSELLTKKFVKINLQCLPFWSSIQNSYKNLTFIYIHIYFVLFRVGLSVLCPTSNRTTIKLKQSIIYGSFYAYKLYVWWLIFRQFVVLIV